MRWLAVTSVCAVVAIAGYFGSLSSPDDRLQPADQLFSSLPDQLFEDAVASEVGRLLTNRQKKRLRDEIARKCNAACAVQLNTTGGRSATFSVTVGAQTDLIFHAAPKP
jgi:hypothetical protein